MKGGGEPLERDSKNIPDESVEMEMIGRFFPG